MHVYVSCACLVSREAREGIRSAATGVTDHCGHHVSGGYPAWVLRHHVSGGYPAWVLCKSGT